MGTKGLGWLGRNLKRFLPLEVGSMRHICSLVSLVGGGHQFKGPTRPLNSYDLCAHSGLTSILHGFLALLL